jgi:hypothetical protein
VWTVRKAVSDVAIACREHRSPEEIDAARYRLEAEKIKQAVRRVHARWPDRAGELADELAQVQP